MEMFKAEKYVAEESILLRKEISFMQNGFQLKTSSAVLTVFLKHRIAVNKVCIVKLQSFLVAFLVCSMLPLYVPTYTQTNLSREISQEMMESLLRVEEDIYFPISNRVRF